MTLILQYLDVMTRLKNCMMNLEMYENKQKTMKYKAFGAVVRNMVMNYLLNFTLTIYSTIKNIFHNF
jgi:hypothetical protein